MNFTPGLIKEPQKYANFRYCEFPSTYSCYQGGLGARQEKLQKHLKPDIPLTTQLWTLEFSIARVCNQLKSVFPDHWSGVSCREHLDVHTALLDRKFQLMHLLDMFYGYWLEP